MVPIPSRPSWHASPQTAKKAACALDYINQLLEATCQSFKRKYTLGTKLFFHLQECVPEKELGKALILPHYPSSPLENTATLWCVGGRLVDLQSALLGTRKEGTAGVGVK